MISWIPIHLICYCLLVLIVASSNNASSSVCQNISKNFKCSFEEIEAQFHFDRPTDVEKLNRNIASVMRHSSIVYGILESVQDDHVEAACAKDSKRIIQGVEQRETWAIKVLDASGNKDAGFVIGNTHWLGSETTCTSIGLGYKITMSDRFQRNTVSDLLVAYSPIPVQFRMIHVEHSSPWQVDMKYLADRILHIGLCLPSSCSNTDVQAMTQNYFHNLTAAAHLDSLHLNAKVLKVKDLKLSAGFMYQRGVVLLLLVTTIAVSLAILAYSIDSQVETPETSTFRRLLLHFSPKQNLAHIYDTTRTSQISMLFGLKAISSFLVLYGHGIFFGLFVAKDKAEMLRLSEEWVNQWISNSQLLVDLFFTISGFLLAYSFFKNRQQIEEIRTEGVGASLKRFGRMVLQRYLRFIPLYFIVTLSVVTALSYLTDTSFFHLQDKSAVNCERYWWRNVFFIQNLYNLDDMCVCWTWSLAAEMQYSTLFLVVLFIYAKNNRAGLKVFFTLASTLFLITLGVTWERRFTPSVDHYVATRNEVYTNPLIRMAPYFPGVAGGWLYSMFKDEKYARVSKKTLERISTLSGIVFLVIFFGSKRVDNYQIAAFISVAERWIFSASVISLVLSNLLSYQGPLARFLSAKIFVHISKIEYAIYLLNPLVVIVVFGAADTSMSIAILKSFATFIVVAATTYPLAVLYTTFFELPLLKLTRELFSYIEHKL